MAILELPSELLCLVLEVSEIPDILAFGQTCRRAYDFVQQNQSLWRSKFLDIFDDPRPIWTTLPPTARQIYKEKSWNWRNELVERLVALMALWDHKPYERFQNAPNLIHALLKIMRTSRRMIAEGQEFRRSRSEITMNRLYVDLPYWAHIIHGHVKDQEITDFPVCADPIWDGPFKRSEIQKLCIPEWASRLHVCRGVIIFEGGSDIELRTAMGIVYNYEVTDASRDFGPFKKDASGGVDWKVLEAIVTLAQDYYHYVYHGMQGEVPLADFNWNIGYYAPRASDDPGDWAGIQGAWKGSYGFLDATDYSHWNIHEEVETAMDLAAYENYNCGAIDMTVELSCAGEMLEDPTLQSKMPSASDLPKLFFVGEATIDRHAASVKGCAWLAPGAHEVRWRFLLCRDDGRVDGLEGVQPAGVRTGYVYGLRRYRGDNDGFYMCKGYEARDLLETAMLNSE